MQDVLVDMSHELKVALLSHGTGTCQDDTNGLDAEGSIKTN